MLMPIYGSYILQIQLISVDRGHVSRSNIFTFLLFLPGEETCRDCASDAWKSCPGQAVRFPLWLCRLCKPPLPLAESRNSIGLLLQASVCDL